jgi:hypothetical protein
VASLIRRYAGIRRAAAGFIPGPEPYQAERQLIAAGRAYITSDRAAPLDEVGGEDDPAI